MFKYVQRPKGFPALLSLLCVLGCAISGFPPDARGTGTSVLDLFPDLGVSQKSGAASCSFEYEPCGSTWNKDVNEEDVFLATLKADTWQLGVGKGGHIYSLRGPYGESVPPQRKESPWNDEVWQMVVTAENVIVPIQDYQNSFHGKKEFPEVWNSTFPLMYFVHQAGIYTKGAGMDGGAVAAPFYSPCLRKRWNAETRTLELVNWMQQARTPCVWKSGILVYTAYRDVGGGVLEVNKVLYNFGKEKLTFLNAPWGGVRYSVFPHSIISHADGSWNVSDGVYGWNDPEKGFIIPNRDLVDTGGWAAWTKDPESDSSPTLALVFGTDANDVSRGKRIDEAFRWGVAGAGESAKIRDYQVAERMSHPHVRTGDSWSIRWYLVSGEFARVRKTAAELSDKAGVYPIHFDETARQSVWVTGSKITTEGKGSPWIQFFAFPAKGTVPVFLLEDKRNGKQVITADPYILAETEPFPNPLPEDFEGREIYDNRVIYKQYAPHIGYENLLGYAWMHKPEGQKARQVRAPEGIDLHGSAGKLWVPE